MNTVLFSGWEWRWDLGMGLGLLGLVYLSGWYRVGRRLWGVQPSGYSPLMRVARLGAYLAGLWILALALMSPVDRLGEQLFLMHMVQHLLLMMIAPPLLLLADPFPVLLWGLPHPVRGGVGRQFRRGASFRQGMRWFTGRSVTWPLFIGCLWIWHLPRAYDAALRDDLIHDLEHFTFFATAMLFWWHVIAVGPHIHPPFSRPARIAYLLVALPFSMLVGVIIALADSPIYTHYTAVPRLWGVSVLQDQMLGGLIMWIPGSMMYVVAALILVRLIVRDAPGQVFIEGIGPNR